MVSKQGFAVSLGVSLAYSFFPQPLNAGSRWSLNPDGGITWTVRSGEAHQDQIEMSGRKVSLILTYAVNEQGALSLTRHVVFPALRIIPNDTYGSLSFTFGPGVSPRIFVDGKLSSNEMVTRIHHHGLMKVESTMGKQGGIQLTRIIFPSVDKPLALEEYVFQNHSDKKATVEVEDSKEIVRTDPSRGVSGAYVIQAKVAGGGRKTIDPGESTSFWLAFSAREARESEPLVDADAEESARRERVASLLAKLQLETPDPLLNAAFAFAKIRTAESIYETKGGLMHGPGGGDYYASIWANDQAEYAGPFFPFLGDRVGNDAALNAYRLFARYMNPDYKPIPSSIIAEGTSFWNGAGDRGDMAMIAYGAGRFALALGNRSTGEELWKLVAWCLEYCRRKVNAQGAVASDSDELEGRFPSGRANLCTSALYFDALNSAVMLGEELGKPESQLRQYAEEAKAMRTAIAQYFGANIQGYDTYRYYDGNEVLRAWICIPLTVGILDRKSGTINALFSPALWTDDGLATQEGQKTFWDRSTLYALRGVLAAGDTDRGMDYLTRYSRRRLLGEHVPYPVEAWPEGNQRHLAAESALYCRVMTEGLFGIRPTGFRAFTAIAHLPRGWDDMRLKNVHAFGSNFDLAVSRNSQKLRVEVIRDGKSLSSQTVEDGQSVAFRL